MILRFWLLFFFSFYPVWFCKRCFLLVQRTVGGWVLGLGLGLGDRFIVTVKWDAIGT